MLKFPELGAGMWLTACCHQVQKKTPSVAQKKPMCSNVREILMF